MRERFLVLMMIVAASVSLGGCQAGYHDGGPVHPVVHVWPLTIDNRTPETLDIYLDGRFVATLSGHTAVSAEAVEGHHTLEAVDIEARVVASRSFYLDTEFIWILER